MHMTVLKVIKKSSKSQAFDIEKIKKALNKANLSTEESSRLNEDQFNKVMTTIAKRLDGFEVISTETIDDFVEMALTRHNRYAVLKSYEEERARKNANKTYTDNEEKVLALIEGDSELRGDNANKNVDDNAAVRDYMAGTLAKSIAQKLLPKFIWKGHNKGWWHFHDSDYSPVNRMHNCDLVNAEDQLENTFVMGNTLISPDEHTKFRTACNLLSQINLQVSGRQYGGQTQSWAHLLKFVQQSRENYRYFLYKRYIEEEPIIQKIRKLLHYIGINTGLYNAKRFDADVEKELRKEVKEGVKIYQYQVLCHSSSNGQTPFVSNNLCLREAETQQELDDMAMIIEEIFKRRIKGVQDPTGRFVSPLFPKLLYWTCDGLNVKEGDPYFYLTKLAAVCESTRQQPDIMSEKQMRKVKKGQIIPTMGCRSLLAPIWEDVKYPITEKFYWDYTCESEEYLKTLSLDTMTPKDFERVAFDYDIFLDKCSFEGMNKRKYLLGEVAINFRGNTGWLKEVGDDYVIITKPIVYGRWNNGVVTINLPHAALTARENIFKQVPEQTAINTEDLMKEFYKVLDDRCESVRKALQIRYDSVSKIKGKNSAILWRYGALARIGDEDTVGDLMKQYPQRASMSLGYVGLCETCYALIGESNTTIAGQELSKEILTYLNNKCEAWKKEDSINYSIYGTPEESLTYKFALANRRDFGVIEHITDKDYVVNSYHVDPREEIDWATKLKLEGQYLALSSGGAVSYVETSDLTKNPTAIVRIIQFIHENIIYAEINRKIGVCYKCGHTGDFPLLKENGKFIFKCPNCGNTDDKMMDVTARICGYLGKVTAGNTNYGRLDDIYHRVLHTDCKEDLIELLNKIC